MAKQRGFSVTELLMVVVIVGIIATIAIPSLVQARRAERVNTFKHYFGVTIPADSLLTGEQRRQLSQHVHNRLLVLCAPPVTDKNISKMDPSLDPEEVQRRLDILALGAQNEVQAAQDCANARSIAHKEMFPEQGTSP